MTWIYDCVHYPVPQFFQFGVYNNGIFTPIGKTTVRSCRSENWQFIVNGTSNLVPAHMYYVRGMKNAQGGFGPATFYTSTKRHRE